MLRGYDRREPALYIAIVIGLFAIGGAWISELMFGFAPCKLCLWQRWPYYLGLPVLLAALHVADHSRAATGMRMLAGLGALIFAVSVGLGVYHAGVEWSFWAGPADCGGRISAGPASVEAFRKSLAGARIVLCTEAAGRFLGLSFAGWNALASALIVVLCLRAARKDA